MGVRPIIRSNKTALIDGHVPAAIHVERLAGGEAGMRSAEEADGAGEFHDGAVALAHRRLSIIDLQERSSQPMISSNGRLAITFNGEIYNYPDRGIGGPYARSAYPGTKHFLESINLNSYKNGNINLCFESTLLIPGYLSLNFR